MTGRPLELAETVFRLYQDLLQRRTGFVLTDSQRSRLESRGANGEPPPVVFVEERSEHRGRIEARHAGPHDGPVATHER